MIFAVLWDFTGMAFASHDAHAQASLVFNCWCQQFTGSFSNQPDTVRRCVNIFTNILDTVLKYIMHKLSCAARFSI